MLSMIGGLGLSFWPGTSVFAQTPGSPASPAGDQIVPLEKFIVTGSHIPTSETAAGAGAYPVTEIDRRMIDQTGFENTAELLQKLPDFNQGAISISNNDTGFTRGATGISLHGLGPEATLVLINGNRVAPFPIGQGGERSFVDLNTIPAGMIERIEILPVGASAIYGADAVAGVVNIILRKNFNGAAIHLQYQNTTDKDASQLTADLLAGVTNEKFSIMVGFNYQKQNSITDADRDYTRIPASLSSNSNPINVQITQAAYDEATGASGLPAGVTKSTFFATPGITPGAPGGNTVSPNGLAVSPSTNNGTTPAGQYLYSNSRLSLYDFNQSAWSLPSWKRDGMNLVGDHDLFGIQNIKAYADGNYQVSTTENQSAPAATGNFTTPGLAELVIPARTANPTIKTVDGRTRAAPAGAYNPFNPFNMDIVGSSRFRLQEFGNRVLNDTTDAFLGTAGIKGENILEKYNFDAGVRYSESIYRSDDTEVSASKFNRILNANDPIFNPNDPSYVGTTIPYNPFGYYVNPIPNNALLVRYATVHIHEEDLSSLGDGYFTINTTDLLKLPAGDIGAAIGVDYRVERLNQSPDPESAAGDLIGEVQKAPVDRRRQVFATYAEMKLPLVSPRQDIPGVYDFSTSVAGRYEGFLTSHESKTVPQAGIRYEPFDDSLVFRADAGQGFLAPSMEELYSTGIFSLSSLVDPRTHASLAQVPVRKLGNSGLKSETSNSYSAGFVWTPKFAVLKGFTANLDVWRIDRHGTALVNAQNTVNSYFNGGGNLPGETVFLDSTGNIVEVNTVYHNAGGTIAKGADIGGSYVRQTNWGLFDFSAQLAFLHSFRQASSPGQPLQELVDTSVDGAGQDAYLRRRAETGIDWSYGNYSFGVIGRFNDGFQDFDANGNPRRVGSCWMWDLQLGYTIKNEAYLKNTTITAGLINLFDRNPPLVISRGNSTDNYPGYIYTSEGREVYVSLDKKF